MTARAIESDDDLRMRRPGRPRRRGEGGRDLDEAVVGPDGSAANGQDPAAGSTRPRASTARAAPGPTRGRPPAHGRVLRERRQGGLGGGDQDPGHPGLLRPAQHRRARCPVRALARSAGPDHPPDDQAPGGRATTPPISWDDAFGSSPTELNGAGRPGRGDLLHLRPDLQRGGLRVPAVHPGVRHQQPARLLQHVPRVDRRSRWPRRSASARPASAWRTSTPRRCSSLAGQNPGTNHPRMLSALENGQEPRRQDHLHQPAARGRAWSTSATRSGRAASSARGRRWPTCTCRSRSTATWRCSRRSDRCWCEWDAIDHDFVDTYAHGFEAWRDHVRRASTGPRSRPRPGCPGSRSPRPPR